MAAFLVFLSVGVDPVYSQTPTWYPITPATPNTEFRFGHQACFSVNGTKKLVVYGGEDESYSYVQETDFFGYCTCCLLKLSPFLKGANIFLPVAKQWLTSNFTATIVNPLPRIHGATAFDTLNSKMYIYGGLVEAYPSNQIIVYNTCTSLLSQPLKSI